MRQEAEEEAERRWREQEETRLQYERDEARRRELDRIRVVEVHQVRDESLEDRGARVIGEAILEERDRQARQARRGYGRPMGRGIENRPEGNSLRRRGTRAGEEIIYDDDGMLFRRGHRR